MVKIGRDIPRHIAKLAEWALNKIPMLVSGPVTDYPLCPVR